jgi:sugar phosphate isomerase/epimerase
VAKLRWSYMEHWSVPSARGPSTQYASVHEMDKFVKQLAAVGFTGLDIFDFHAHALTEMFGSLERYEPFLNERGLEKVVGVFHAPTYLESRFGAPHIRESHDALLANCERVMQSVEPLQIETFVVMPAASYPYVEPVTDEKIAIMGEFWNRVGEMTLRYGVKTAAHHEFWCGIRSVDEIEKFYAATDPSYVYFCVDTAQHVIAGVDPVALYRRYADRCCAFHFKDTHDVDPADEYRTLPDAELAAGPVKRWFWEMGTPEGLVDWEGVMQALADTGYEGWVTVEHDKADIGGGSYSESTSVAMWYQQRVLSRIYA